MSALEDWFGPIYIEGYDRLVKLAYHVTGDQRLAEDLTHNAFVTMLAKHGELMSHPNIQGWLTATLKNLISSELQRARYSRETPLLPEHEVPASGMTDDFLSVLPGELSEEERRILYLHIEAGYHHDEIAAGIGCTADACKMRLYRAKRHCRDLMEEDFKKF